MVRIGTNGKIENRKKRKVCAIKVVYTRRENIFYPKRSRIYRTPFYLTREYIRFYLLLR